MSCSSRSENRLAVLLRIAADLELPVFSVGVWHSAQPTLVEQPACRARSTSAPPGVLADGVGGARKRMKSANFSTQLSTPARRCRRALVIAVGHLRELAGRGLVAFGLEQLVGDAHLHVVGLAGEEQQRLVLRLPAEAARSCRRCRCGWPARDRVGVEQEVGPAADAEAALGSAVRWLRGSRCPGSPRSGRRRTPAWGCGRSRCGCAIWRAKSGCAMLQPACVVAAGDREQRVHAAVGRAVGVAHEARLAHRAVRR